MSCNVGEATEGLENELWRRWSDEKVGEWALLWLNYELCSFSKLSVTSPMSQLILILQAFRHFTYVTAHSPILPLLHLHHNSFSNPSVASPHRSFSNPSLALRTSKLILQPFRCFTYVTANSPTLPSLYLRQNSFSNPSLALPTSQLIIQPFRCFTYVTAHSPTLPFHHLHHNSFSNLSFASPTSQALHLRHLASRSWNASVQINDTSFKSFFENSKYIFRAVWARSFLHKPVGWDHTVIACSGYNHFCFSCSYSVLRQFSQRKLAQ